MNFILGILMIVVIFGGLFVLIGKISGWLTAIFVYALTFGVCTWVVIAAYLLTR